MKNEIGIVVYNKDMNIMQQAESHMFYHKSMIIIQ